MAETVAPEDQEDNGTPPTDSTTTNTNPDKKDDSNLAQVTLVNFDGGNDANETGEQESVVPKTEKDLCKATLPSSINKSSRNDVRNSDIESKQNFTSNINDNKIE